jgi:hypothetical protein
MRMMRRGTLGIVGGAAALIVGAVAAYLLIGSGGPSVAQAGERLSEDPVRLRVENVDVTPDGRHRSTIEGVVLPAGETGRVTVTSIREGEAEERSEWIFRPGESWVRHDAGEDWYHFVDDDTGPIVLTPRDYARMLEIAEEIREIDEHHYKAVFDVRRFTDGDGSNTEERLRGMFSPRVTRQPVEAWLDDDGSLNRIHLSMRTAGGARYESSATFLEIGAKPDIEPPAAETVIEG